MAAESTGQDEGEGRAGTGDAAGMWATLPLGTERRQTEEGVWKEEGGEGE